MAYSQEDKKLLLQFLEAFDFNVKKSVEKFNKKTTHSLERGTVYDWLNNDKLFKKEFDTRQKDLVQDAEHYHELLRKGIPITDPETNEIIAWQEKPDRAAIEFFLKNKGGYVDKVNTDITSKGESINDIKKISFKNTTKKEDDF